MRAAALRPHSRPPDRVTVAALLLAALGIVALGLATPGSAGAGPWLREPGETYVKAGLFLTSGSEQFDRTGAVTPLFDPATVASGRYQEIGANVYVEHGLYRDFTLVVDALFKSASLESDGFRATDDRRGTSYGIPDLRVGGRLPLSRGPLIAAFEPSIQFPLRAVGRSSPDAPALGTPSAAFTGAVSAGVSVPRLGVYVQGSGGYRLRAGREPNEWLADAEIGAALAGPFRVRARFDLLDARDGGGASGTIADGVAAMPAPETGGQDLRRVAPAVALGFRDGSEISLAWRRAIGGRSALRSDQWELAYAFLGVTAGR